MTTIATLAADSRDITIGGGWITLMLVGMGLCFVFMLGSMGLMRHGRGWTMCGRWWQQTPRQETLTDTTVGRAKPPAAGESEASR